MSERRWRECAQCQAQYPHETKGHSPCCDALLVSVVDDSEAATPRDHAGLVERLRQQLMRWEDALLDGLWPTDLATRECYAASDSPSERARYRHVASGIVAAVLHSINAALAAPSAERRHSAECAALWSRWAQGHDIEANEQPPPCICGLDAAPPAERPATTVAADNRETMLEAWERDHPEEVAEAKRRAALAAPPAERATPAKYPIPLNEAQERAAKEWAADDRLWTTQETVEQNLRTFARVILRDAERPVVDLDALARETLQIVARLLEEATSDGYNDAEEVIRAALARVQGGQTPL